MRLFISYIAFFAVVMLSCNNKANQQYIVQINNLSMQLENAANIYSAVDSMGILEIRSKVKDNCSRIDHIDDSSFKRLNISYCNISKSIKQILKLDAQLKKNILISKTQINDLLYDANNNIVDTILLMQYIEDEKEIVSVLIDRMNYNYERVMVESTRYDSLNPLIEKLINLKK